MQLKKADLQSWGWRGWRQVGLIYVAQHMEGTEGAPRKLPFVPSKHGASLNANNAQ